jgi:FkbM family methyltransferase
MYYPSAESCQIAGLAELYEEYFGQKINGQFVEVGAYNGYDFSNVWGLAEAGWKGLCIEPIPDFATSCKANHEKHQHWDVTTIESAAGSYDGIVILTFGGVDSTIDPETVDRSPFGFIYDATDTRQCNIAKLDTLLDGHVRKGFDVISIDVEGAELQVLDGFDISYWEPKMIIIETHIGVPGRDYHAQAIISYITKYGYRQVGGDALNTIFWNPTYPKQGDNHD